MMVAARSPEQLDVVRPRLFAHLDAHAEVTVIGAPAGFGKTTLVMDWLAQRPGGYKSGWLIVSESADSWQLWRDVLDVLAGTHTEHRLNEALPSNPLAAVREAVRRLGAPYILVIDRAERLTGEMAGQLLELAHASRHFKLIVLGRSVGHFNGVERQDAKRSTAIEAAELLLTAHESTELLGGWGIDLPPDSIDELVRELSGWPGATSVFAAAYRNAGKDPLRFAAALSAGRGYIRDVVAAHVSSRAEAALLTALSITEEFTEESAEAVTGESNSIALIHRMTGDAFLSEETDGSERVFRWRAPVRRAFNDQLVRQAPEYARSLETRLMRYYSLRSDFDRALGHAVRARDWPAAVTLIEEDWYGILFLHPRTLVEALQALPHDVIRQNSTVLAVRAAVLDLAFDPDAFPAAGTSSRIQLEHLGASSRVRIHIGGLLALMCLFRSRGLIERATRYMEDLDVVLRSAQVNHTNSVARLTPVVLAESALVLLLAGDTETAIEQLRSAHSLAQDSDPRLDRTRIADRMALAYGLRGEVTKAVPWLERQPNVQLPDEASESVSAVGTLARVIVAGEQLDGARGTTALDLLNNRQTVKELWALTCYAQAWPAMLWSDPSSVLDQLRYRQTVHRARLGAQDPFTQVIVVATEASLLMSLGRGNEARSVLAAATQGHVLLTIARGRLALLTGDMTAALALACDDSTQAGSMPAAHVDLLLIQAIAQHRLGERALAAQALRRAIGLARTLGSLLPFTAVPRDELLDLASYVPDVEEFLHAEPLRSAPEMFPARLTLVDLTRREWIVLDKLAQHLKIHEIAADLYVSTNTVKTQLRSMYRKLGVNSREQALMVAHSLGVLGTSASQSAPSAGRAVRSGALKELPARSIDADVLSARAASAG